jgi:2-polyprenyl-3-methyl-5-hydroxy-6-metoxy-1,4-benzoquinol methylase
MTDKTSPGPGEPGQWDPEQHYKNTDVAKNYDDERFSGLGGKIYIAREKRALRKALADVAPGSTIVDLPTGTGRIAEFLLEEGYKVVGMDVSPEMLQVAQQRLERFGDQFTTKVTNAFELTASDPTYDAALCARVLMHFPVDQQIQFLTGVKTLTDGPIIFTQSYVTPYQRLRQMLKRLIGIGSYVMYPLAPKDLDTLLTGAGLRLERKHWVARAVGEAVIFVCRK